MRFTFVLLEQFIEYYQTLNIVHFIIVGFHPIHQFNLMVEASR